MRRTVASHVGRGRVLVVDEAQDPDTAGSGHGRIWTRPGRNGFAAAESATFRLVLWAICCWQSWLAASRNGKAG